jgi:hypothetical protein
MIITLALALSGMLWLGLRQPGLTPDTAIKLTGLDPAQVTRIGLSRDDGAGLELQRNARGWRLVAPAVLPANRERVRDLLDITGATSFTRYRVDRVDLSAVGLAPARATLRLNEVTVLFGDRAPVEGYRYTRTAQWVKLISNVHYHTVSLDLADFVSTRLLPPEWRLRRILLPDLRLERVGQDEWQAAGDIELSSPPARRLAERWQEATAAAVQRWVPGLATVGRLTLFSDDSDQGLEFAMEQLENAPDFILARPDLGLRYHFSPRVGALLMGNSTALTNTESADEEL